jgi:hypothetical protein
VKSGAASTSIIVLVLKHGLGMSGASQLFKGRSGATLKRLRDLP